MIKATLNTRSSEPVTPTSAGGSYGELVASKDDGSTFTAETAERPPNDPDHKPAPGGVYKVVDCNHPEHGMCYQLVTGPGTPAPDRTGLLIHPGNVYWQSFGCILLGRTLTQFGKDACHPGMPPRNAWGVTDSGNTLKDFMAFCAGDDIELTIIR